jgi:hypothetical protein
VARPVRFELTTYSSGGCRSIHLSYGRAVAFLKTAAETRSSKKTTAYPIILTLAHIPRHSAFGAARCDLSAVRAEGFWFSPWRAS